MRTSKKKYPITNAVLPTEINQFIPFSKEQINKWNKNNDIAIFLAKLFRGTGYESYGEHLYNCELNNVKELAVSFDDHIVRFNTDRDKKYKISIVSFLDNPSFGKLSKYLISWKGIVSNILSESSFFSIIHILESEQDLESSIRL